MSDDSEATSNGVNISGSETKVGGDVAGRDKNVSSQQSGTVSGDIKIVNVYQPPPPAQLILPAHPPPSNQPVPTRPGQYERTDDGCLTGVDWGARDQKLLQEYFSMCAKHDDDFKEHVEPDESRLRDYFCENGLADHSPGGTICLTQAGVLLCCRKKRFPYKDLHVHVKFQNKTDPAELTEELFGSVMFLYMELSKRLAELSKRKMGSPNTRDASGAEAVFYDYPPIAIVEALVNSLIHRDYHSDDIGFVTIYSDRLELINPGKSRIPVADLLEAKHDIHPRYPRNPRLIEAMNKARLNQRAGSGLRRIREELSRNGSFKPDGSLGLEISNDEENDRFALTIFRRRSFEGDLVEGNKIVIQQPLPTPRFQLPPPPADFTGREAELRELRAAIREGGVHISGLQGQGGVGKTALALKLAAELAASFPDGQIYLDLKGVSEKPLTSAEALSHVLRTFHPEAKLPEKEADLSSLFRSVLHDKRAFLLLDNAKDAAQVRPLIPPAGCMLMVTSRTHFTLPGLYQKNLNTFTPEDAKKFLLEIAPRIQTEAEAIAKLCGYLALALRLAATAIADHIDLSPTEYRRKLADEEQRLRLLGRNQEESLEASVTLSYNLLDEEKRKHWRMLSVFPDTFDALAVSAVWEMDTVAAQGTLSLLVQYSMVEWDETTRRYRLHELMRDFLREQLTLVESVAARRNHSKYYGAVLADANALYLKGGQSTGVGLALFDSEWENIRAGQAWAATHAHEDSDAARLCAAYPDWGNYVISLRRHPREQISWRDAALASARRLGSDAAKGRHLSSLAIAYHSLGDYHRAIEYSEEALATARKIDDKQGEGTALGNLGLAYHYLGETRRDVEYFERHLALAREVGDKLGEATALGNLGLAYHYVGDADRALSYQERALFIARETGFRQGEATALGNLGNAHHLLGNYALAIEHYEQQLKITREIGDRRGECNALWNLSLALDQLGDRQKAIEHAQNALKIREQVDGPKPGKIRKKLEEWLRP